MYQIKHHAHETTQCNIKATSTFYHVTYIYIHTHIFCVCVHACVCVCVCVHACVCVVVVVVLVDSHVCGSEQGYFIQTLYAEETTLPNFLC